MVDYIPVKLECNVEWVIDISEVYYASLYFYKNF